MTNKKDAEQRQGTCAFCGKFGFVDKDHVPPKILFPKPRPSIMLTVPSCKDCHKNTGLDDTYFRDYLGLREDVSAMFTGAKVAGAAVKDLKRSKREGSLKNLQFGYESIDIETPSGVFIETRPSVPVNHERIENEVKRIVRGLVYIETKEIVPAGFRLVVLTDIFKYPDVDLSSIYTIYQSLPEKTNDARVFSYRVHFSGQESFWFLTFYETVIYLVTVEHESRPLIQSANRIAVVLGSPRGFIQKEG